jgi:hypothetical protein
VAGALSINPKGGAAQLRKGVGNALGVAGQNRAGALRGEKNEAKELEGSSNTLWVSVLVIDERKRSL